MKTTINQKIEVSDQVTLKTRLAKISDLDSVVSLQSKCADWLSSKGLEHWVESRRNDKRFLADLNNGLILVAEEVSSEEILTSYVLIPNPPQYHTEEYFEQWAEPFARAQYLKKLCVHPDYMKAGIARKLMHQALNISTAKGAEYIRLDVNKNIESLREFYHSFGFKQMAEMEERYLLELKLN